MENILETERKGNYYMSTNEKMLGKESNKKKAHRRYSMLLLALLFIGFATYGTYAYFTSSTSTTKGNLTLNGMNASYQVGGGSGTTADTKTGDGVTNTNDSNNNTEFVPDNSGNGDGKFEPVKDDLTTDQKEDQNSTQFGEFDWVYVGNSKNDLGVDGLLTSSLALTAYNKFVTTTDHQIFGNVVGGDVFRKTVRLKVEGSATVPLATTLSWDADGTDAHVAENLMGAVFVKRGEAKDLANFVNSGFAKAIDINSPANYTDSAISVKPGQYLDMEIVVQVKNSATADNNLNLAKIARQLKVTLKQDVTQSGNNGVFASKTASN